MIHAYLSGDHINSNASAAFSLYDKSLFGEKRGQVIEYAPIETLYLVREGLMRVLSGSKELSYDALLLKLKRKDARLGMKSEVFHQLRKKGYIVKTALKFGADFRIYDKGVRPGKEHARWLLTCFKAHDKVNWHDLAAKLRVAHSTKKKLVLAIIDEESSVSYYESGWLKL
ncbi:tRNA-intron lyase [Candidatus Pacearchaeota archaeon]|nr:tRNA-intron lyase [Candidatus Pacearchaeota archaeon]